MYVVYHSSDSFVEVTCVSIASLLENNKSMDKIEIFYISKGISERNKGIITEFVEKYGRKINFIEMPNWSEKYNINLSTTLKRWLGMGYNRLFITELLSEKIDKVLYLDSDTIVDGCLDKLWDLDLGDNYMAGVDDCLSGKYRKLVDISENGTYCNSGVLILNLKKFRDNNIIEKFLKFISNHKGFIVFNEQSILNSVFAGKVYILPLKYNVYSLVFAFKRNELMNLRKPYKYSYNEKEYESAKNKPVIVHYTGCFIIAKRPWIENSDHPFVEKFIYYRNMTPFKESAMSKDNRGTLSKIYCGMCKVMPRGLTINAVSILYNYIRPIMFENKRKKHINN